MPIPQLRQLNTSPAAYCDAPDIWTQVFENPHRSFDEDKVVLVQSETSETVTYSQVRDGSRAFGAALVKKFGIKQDDVVAVLSPNHTDAIIVAFGIAWTGALMNLLSPVATKEALVYHLKDSSTKVLVVHAYFEGLATTLADEAGVGRENIFILGGESKSFPSWKDFSKGVGSVPKPLISSRDNVAMLNYTSGTTSAPKGVMTTHANIMFLVSQLGAIDGPQVKLNGSLLLVVPWSHYYGFLVLTVYSFHLGIKTVLLQKPDFITILHSIADYKVTNAPLVPALIAGLLHPAARSIDFSALTDIFVTAANLKMPIRTAVEAQLGLKIRSGYGMTEGVFIYSSSIDYETMDTSGLLIPGLTAKIVLETGEEARAPGQVGEFWIKGPAVFKGYFNRPDINEKVFTKDGFFKTGDLTSVDVNGAVSVHGRRIEAIYREGNWVIPQEVEEVIDTHPSMKESVMVPVVVDGEKLPKAFVVVNEGIEQTAELLEEILMFVNAKLSAIQQLHAIAYIETVPKSLAGKIHRTRLV